MSFPTLKRGPVSCPSEPIDNAISTNTEAGYVQARPRYTRQRTTFGPVTYLIDDADWALLEAHDKSVGSWGIFSWTHPVSGTTYQVRYSKRVKETPQKVDDGEYLHSCEFTLETV